MSFFLEADRRPCSINKPTVGLKHCHDCTKVYGRKSELDRHIREKHKDESGRFLCPVDLCPRSIKGEGFDRMCHLIAHLTTKQEGHKMDKTRAKYEARKANPQKNGAKKE